MTDKYIVYKVYNCALFYAIQILPSVIIHFFFKFKVTQNISVIEALNGEQSLYTGLPLIIVAISAIVNMEGYGYPVYEFTEDKETHIVKKFRYV